MSSTFFVDKILDSYVFLNVWKNRCTRLPYITFFQNLLTFDIMKKLKKSFDSMFINFFLVKHFQVF